MRLLVLGSPGFNREIEEKFSHLDQIHHNVDPESFLQEGGANIVFDSWDDESLEHLDIYARYPDTIVFLNTVKTSLAEVNALAGPFPFLLFGFCGLPTFINRPVMEVTTSGEADKKALGEVFKKLKSEYRCVEDRVGMITPRIITMIINEAYLTVQEGTATREDIDLGMKLGTNYPYGPFEWCEKLGIHHVYEILDALYEDTHDERYKIAPLLKKEYLAFLTAH